MTILEFQKQLEQKTGYRVISQFDELSFSDYSVTLFTNKTRSYVGSFKIDINELIIYNISLSMNYSELVKLADALEEILHV